MSNATTAEFERKALELMPWYVNGTLEGEDRELVRSQVLASLTCRKELERLRRLQELMKHDDAEAIATDREFEKLMARIHATETTGGSPPGGTAQLAIAASLVAAATALAWWWVATPVTAPAPYETLTTTQPAGAPVRLRVVFEPGVGETERQAVFARHRLRPVAPPTAEGLYTLGFPDGADQAAIVAALREDPRIRLVTSPPLTEAQ